VFLHILALDISEISMQTQADSTASPTVDSNANLCVEKHLRIPSAAQSMFLLGVKDITAGSVGGVFQCLSGHPLDTIKVRLQTQPTDVKELKYKGTVHAFSTIVKEEGFGGLYKGVQSPLLGMAFLNSVLFLSYGQAKAWMQTGNEPLTIRQLWTCGAIVGVCVAVVEGPVDFFKSQLQSQYGGVSKYNGFFDCAKKIITNHGVRGLYQGLGATFLRDIPANATYFGVYEMVRQRFLKPGQSVNDLPAQKVLVAGGIAGMAYWAATYPIDVIKSTLQTDSTVYEERKYKTVPETARKIWQASGWKGFWKGFTPCMLRSFPANAVCFLGYEYTRILIG
jgi:solute carrier family 25 carnitine/acylcarnitine transporter 20/29